MLLIVALVQAALAGNKIRIMTQNVENFFYQYQPDNVYSESDEGYIANLGIDYKLANREAKMEAILKAYFRDNIPVADIYCFNEIECSDDILNYIAQNFKNKIGIDFAIIQDGLETFTSSGIIRKSGYIYNPTVVKPYGTSMATGIGTVYTRFMRMQTFEEIESGERFTLSVNHFKAGDQTNTDYTNSNAQMRLTNATDLLASLGNALDPDILIVGDLNSYMAEPCLQKLVENGYEEQIFRFNPNAYSAGWGVGNFIDHVFANSTMAEQVTSAKFYYVATKYSQDVIDAYSDHDPYMVELELKKSENAKTYVKATEVKDGGQYLIVANGDGNVRKLCGVVSGSYGNMPAIDVEEKNGCITLDTESQLFTFEAVGSNFYIKDPNGKYLSNGYNNNKNQYFTTFTPTDKNGAQPYSVSKQSDGRFELKNTTSNNIIYYGGAGYKYADNMFASYARLNDSRQQYPFLYEIGTSSSITGTSFYSQPTTTRKVMEKGRMVIVTPNGTRYNMQGIQLK